MTNKYRNIKTEVEGIVFDSRKEAKYYLYLKQLLHDGKISSLQRQVPYELVPAVYEEQIIHLKTKDKAVKKLVQRPILYVADFVYVENTTGETVVVDVKGQKATMTKEFVMKKKMMLAFLNIKIKLV